MVTDDELDILAESLGCEIKYMGGDVWECYHKAENYCSYGDYLQIYQLLEDLRFRMLVKDSRKTWAAVALKA